MEVEEALNKAQKDIERLYEEENAELGALNLIAARELKKAAKAIAKTNKVKWIQNEKNKTAEKSVRGSDKMRLRKNQSQASSVKLEVKDQLLKGNKIQDRSLLKVSDGPVVVILGCLISFVMISSLVIWFVNCF